MIPNQDFKWQNKLFLPFSLDPGDVFSDSQISNLADASVGEVATGLVLVLGESCFFWKNVNKELCRPFRDGVTADFDEAIFDYVS